MSRLKKYQRSLLSGYVLLGANVLFTLASVPLALRYLSKAEFGLWALTSQVALYLGVLDFGMSGAAMRILIDHKDDPEGTGYGSVLQTSFLVNLVQAALVLGCGLAAAWLLGPMLEVPVELWPSFRGLLMWQSLLLAISAVGRPILSVLTAHQRYDVVNGTQAAMFAVGFGVLWWGFAHGAGVYSFVWAQWVNQGLGLGITGLASARLGLWPARGKWGRPAWRWFHELFAYGRDLFLYSVGHLLINFSQTMLITRVAGLEMAAVWSVCTRVFALLTQALQRLFDYSCSGFAEMIVRGEQDRLFTRFKSLVILSTSLAVVAGGALAAANQAFVEGWTRGRIGWPAVNDWLLAAWLPVLVAVRSHTGLIGLTKQFRFLRYIYLCEGLFFVAGGLAGLRLGGIPAMLTVAVLGSLSITGAYGLWRTSQLFHLAWRTVALDWALPSARLALMVWPVAGLLAWLTQPMGPWWRLVLNGGLTGLIGLGALLRWGLDEPMRRELGGRLPAGLGWLRRWCEGQPVASPHTPA